jgi:hypothetical protein
MSAEGADFLIERSYSVSNSVRLVNKILIITALFMLILPVLSYAQAGPGAIKGQVTDQTGAVIPGATVTAKSSTGLTVSTTSDRLGEYTLKGLTPGLYTITANAPSFAAFELPNVQVTTGVKSLPIEMQIEVEQQHVQVDAEAPEVHVSAENNASSTVLRGKDLQALSDDPDELQSELEALAGPSAGPNGGQIYIDGFTGGQLPPKSSIREIRINSNPFSAEYDKLGYSRIEILTKPGTNQLHGQVSVNGNDSSFNSPNPFIHAIPPYYTDMFSGSLSGPISKKASFFINAERRNINNASVSNYTTNDLAFTTGAGTTCTPLLGNYSCSLAVANPRDRYNVSGRIDYQLTQNNTITGRYQFTNDNETNDISGQQFQTASQLFNSSYTEHTVQVMDTQTISSHIVNEMRFQYRHFDQVREAQNFSPTINVIGSFTAGGNGMGVNRDTQNNYEIQNYTSIQHGLHLIKFGGRFRLTNDSSTANSNFNGTFTFPSLNAYAAGMPSQFSITTGQPLTAVTWEDVGLYAEDEWRLRPTMSLTYGLRYETQNVIHDHKDFAPRLGFSWGINGGQGKTPRTVLRAGFGIFYDRFGENLYLNSVRLNGMNQQQIVVANPTFYPNVPPVSELTSVVGPTIYQIQPHLHSPYTVQSAVGVEQQVGRSATVSVTYLNSRGFDQLLTNNINAPLPGTYNPAIPGSGVRPYGNIGNIYQYQSEGIFRQNQLIANTNIRLSTRLTVAGFYTLNYANSDTNGAGSFPSDPYNLMADYGRAAFDIRHRIVMFSSIAAPFGLRFSPMFVFTSGQPFSITTGTDVNGDSIFNDRPAVASGPATVFAGPGIGPCPATATACGTPWGVFNLVPGAGTAVIPPNYLTGPNHFMVNMRIAKTFGFGKVNGGGTSGEGPHGSHGPHGGLGGRGLGGGGFRGIFGSTDQENHRYQMTFAVFARNLFNNVNLVPPVASLTSPLVGTSNAINADFFGGSAANRRIDLSLTFTF